MTADLAIKTRGLIKSYGSVHALRGVNLEVQRGEIFGFLGPNGAGKTTTIRCLLDLIRPNGGTIQVLGLNPQVDSVSIRARTSYLPGELHLEENMNSEEMLRYLNALRGNRADWGFVRQLSERFSLDLKSQIKNLSHGNRQKVAIVQAFMHHPELLLLDEPTTGLDPLMQQEVLHLITEAQKEGATTFFSSHIISEVEAVAERVAIIRMGKIVEVAKISSLINRAIHHIRIKFKKPVDTSTLIKTPGVKILSKHNSVIFLEVRGEMDRFLKALSLLPVSTFETEHPSLEEIFMAYYKK